MTGAADTLRVLLLARYGERGASTRVRSLQHLPLLREHGIEVTVAPLLDDGYLERIYAGRRPRWGGVARSYARRVRDLLGASGYDVIWIEKEALPWLPASCERLLRPGGPALVVDYDDAVFHRYDRSSRPWVRALLGTKIDAVMRSADLVLVGNRYLEARARSAGAVRIETVPSVVDVTRYDVVEPPGDALRFGWIGTPRTSRYLEAIAPALAVAARECAARVVLVGADENALAGVEGLEVERRRWSQADEAAALSRIDVGLMPLPDEPFERGKCGYKLIQYMACARPVVASPVGFNSELVRDGENGYLAGSTQAWSRALLRLADDQELRARMGRNGRSEVESRYSTRVVGPRLAELLRTAAAGTEVRVASARSLA